MTLGCPRSDMVLGFKDQGYWVTKCKKHIEGKRVPSVRFHLYRVPVLLAIPLVFCLCLYAEIVTLHNVFIHVAESLVHMAHCSDLTLLLLCAAGSCSDDCVRCWESTQGRLRLFFREVTDSLNISVLREWHPFPQESVGVWQQEGHPASKSLYQLPLMECTVPPLLFLCRLPFSWLRRTWWDGVKEDAWKGRVKAELVNRGWLGRMDISRHVYVWELTNPGSLRRMVVSRHVCVIYVCSALTLLDGHQEGHPAFCKQISNSLMVCWDLWETVG